MSGIFVMPSPEKNVLPACFNPSIPLFTIERFVKRDALLCQIDATFLSFQSPNVSPTRLTACYGLGGIGKTQLALYYYYKSPKTYSLRCWFLAERLEENYREFCQRFQIHLEVDASFEIISRKVRQWLEENPGWLLIYDNAIDTSITQHLPKTGGNILLTSRQALNWSQIGREIKVDTVSESEAVELVKRAISDNGIPVLLEEKEGISLKELARELGYLPLALAQAAGYIKSCPGMRITLYLEKYNRTPDIYLDKPLDESVYPKSVAKTWFITIEEIEKRLPAALLVLKACAYLAPEGIPIQLLSKLVLELKLAKEEREEKEEDDQTLDGILIVLSRFSMIGYNKETGYINIHRLVQRVIQQDDEKSLSTQACFEKRLQSVAKTLHSLYPSFYYKTLSEIEQARHLQLHMERVSHFLRPWIMENTEHQKTVVILQVNLLLNLSNLFITILGKAAGAKPLIEEALTLSQKTWGEECSEVSASFLSLGEIEYDLGRYKESKEHFENSLSIRLKLYDEDTPHSDVANSYNFLGNACYSLGNHKKALDYYQKSLEIYLKFYGDTHQSVADSYNSLGLIYDSLGEPQKALHSYYQPALDIYLKVYGNSHPDVANSYNKLGNVHDSLGKTQKALKYYGQAFEIYLNIYGNMHPYVASSYNNLGNACDTLGKPQEALRYHEEALNIRLKIYNDSHPLVATSYNSLGNAYDSLGRNQEAFECQKKALDIDLKTYGHDPHPSVATSYNNLGNACKKLGEIGEALDYYQKALDIYLKVYGSIHPDVALIYCNFGVIYQFLRDMDAARENLEEALAIYQQLNREKEIANIKYRLMQLSILVNVTPSNMLSTSSVTFFRERNNVFLEEKFDNQNLLIGCQRKMIKKEKSSWFNCAIS